MSNNQKSIETVRASLDEWIPKESVSKRKGSQGMELSYIEGHEVVRQLNRILGQGNWQYQITELRTTLSKQTTKQDYRTGKERTANLVGMLAIVSLTAKLSPEHTVTFTEVGNGKGIDYGDGFDAHEASAKEAVTDAFKRAAKNLGERVGLCLYDKDIRESIENGDDQRDTVPATQPAPANTKNDVQKDQNSESQELMRLISATFKVANAKKKLTVSQVQEHLKSKYSVSSKEELSLSQAKEFLAFLQTQV